MNIALFALTYLGLIAACAAGNSNVSAGGARDTEIDPIPKSAFRHLRHLQDGKKEKGGGGKEKNDEEGKGGKKKEDDEQIEEPPEDMGVVEVAAETETEAPGPVIVDTFDFNVAEPAPQENEVDEADAGAAAETEAPATENVGTNDSSAAEQDKGVDSVGGDSSVEADGDNQGSDATTVDPRPDEEIQGYDATNTDLDALNIGDGNEMLTAQEQSGMKPVGKAFLSIFCIGAFAGLIFLAMRRRRKAAAAYESQKDEIAPPNTEDEEAPSKLNQRDLVLIDTKDTVDSREMVPADSSGDSDIDVVVAGEESTSVEVALCDENTPPPPPEHMMQITDGTDDIIMEEEQDIIFEDEQDELNLRRYQISDTVDI